MFTEKSFAYRFLERKLWTTRVISTLRWTSFFSAYLAISVAFSMFAFTVYQEAIKSQFGYSQAQVELLMSLEWLGAGVNLPGGFFIKKYGIRWSSLVALVLPTTAHFLISDSFSHTTFYSSHYGLLACYFFMAGCGAAFTYLVAISATVGNFSEKNRCTVISLLTSATSIGPLFYISAYDAFFIPADSTTLSQSSISNRSFSDDLIYENFTGGNPKDVKTPQNVGGYFLLITISYAVANSLSLIFHGEYPPEEEELEVTPQVEEDEEIALLASKKSREKEEISSSELTPQSGYMSISEVKNETFQTGDVIKTPARVPSPDEGCDMYCDEYNSALSLMDISRTERPENNYPESLSTDNEQDRPSTFKNQRERATCVQKAHQPNPDRQWPQTLGEVLRMRLYYYLALPSIFLMSLGPTVGNNLTTVLISMELTDYITIVPFIAVWSGIIGKIFIGYISDKVVHVFPRGGFVLLGAVISAVSYCFNMFLLSHVTTIIVNVAICNMGTVVIACLVPSIFLEEFGQSHFVILWGLIQVFYGVGAFILQYTLGGLYDLQLTSESDTATCYGQICFVWTYLICTGLCVIASILSGKYVWRRRHLFKCCQASVDE